MGSSSAQYAGYAGTGTELAFAAATPALVSAGVFSAAAAGPIGAAIAGVTLLISALIANSGCGPTCVVATGIVDELEKHLKANRDAYLSGPHTAELQTLALANFDAAMTWLASRQACGAPELGDAGRRCISDRTRGGKWDWFAYYRDPIAAASPAPTTDAAVFSNLGQPGQNAGPWLIAAALILAGVFA